MPVDILAVVLVCALVLDMYITAVNYVCVWLLLWVLSLIAIWFWFWKRLHWSCVSKTKVIVCVWKNTVDTTECVNLIHSWPGHHNLWYLRQKTKREYLKKACESWCSLKRSMKIQHQHLPLGCQVFLWNFQSIEKCSFRLKSR